MFCACIVQENLYLAGPLSSAGGLRCDALRYRIRLLPEFTSDGDLPAGVHLADWAALQNRFGSTTLRRMWLFGRLQALVALAANTGKLSRIFVWGSFVTAKPSPKDLDILLIMDADFETEHMDSPTQAIFDSTRAKLQFEADVFWARDSIGDEILRTWLETYQISRSFRKSGIVELELP